VVIGRADATAHGGHLMQGYVRPTMEIILTESPSHLRRKYHADVGLSLISLNDID
jgi:predicted DNA-binding protein with PD1-like motif